MPNLSIAACLLAASAITVVIANPGDMDLANADGFSE